MVDKRKDSNIPDDITDDDQEINLVSSVRDINTTQLRNIKNQTRETEEEQHLEDLKTEAWSQESIFQREEWAQPHDSNFSLDQYANSGAYKVNRDLDHEDEWEAQCYKDGKTRGLGKGAAAATIAVGAIGAVELGRRQKEFNSVLPDVEKTTGVPAKLVGAFWGNESGFGKNLLSPTGCLGDGQFTRGTWAAMIKQYGDRIPGMEKFADDLRSGKIKESDPELQKMRLDTKASAYAMGFYINEVARELKVDPKDEKNWGIIYAGYNVGPGNAKKLRNNMDSNGSAMAMLGSVAQNNPMFYDKGRATPAQAVANYDVVILQSAKRFDTKVAAILNNTDTDVAVAQAKTDKKASEPISVASTVSGPAITSAAKPKEGFTEAKTDAQAKAKVDETVKTAQADVTAFGKFKTMLYGYVEGDKEPAPKLAEVKPKVPLHNLVYG